MSLVQEFIGSARDTRRGVAFDWVKAAKALLFVAMATLTAAAFVWGHSFIAVWLLLSALVCLFVVSAAKVSGGV